EIERLELARARELRQDRRLGAEARYGARRRALDPVRPRRRDAGERAAVELLRARRAVAELRELQEEVRQSLRLRRRAGALGERHEAVDRLHVPGSGVLDAERDDVGEQRARLVRSSEVGERRGEARATREVVRPAREDRAEVLHGLLEVPGVEAPARE